VLVPLDQIARISMGKGPAQIQHLDGKRTVTVSANVQNGRASGEVTADAMKIAKAGGKAVANANSVATMDGGASIVKSALDAFGRIDGVVCVAGILRERMLFNMAEEDWDPVIATHLRARLRLSCSKFG
jgi:NAD(P)-dependent dehydrogenase (short-subunit alcohol dehydrogenase family)